MRRLLKDEIDGLEEDEVHDSQGQGDQGDGYQYDPG